MCRRARMSGEQASIRGFADHEHAVDSEPDRYPSGRIARF